MNQPDKNTIRLILEQDRAWSLYALGDLAEPFYSRCEWILENRSLALVYEGFRPPILFLTGTQDDISKLVQKIRHPEVSLSVRLEDWSLLSRHYSPKKLAMMWRMMIVDPVRPVENLFTEVTRLTRRDLSAIGNLFQSGEESGEAPDAFQPSMVDDGVYYGIWVNNFLAAVAGTHLINTELGVAAIGNVYVKREYRGRGFGYSVTSAVTRELIRMNIPSIGLNVKQDNLSAIAIYEKIGFKKVLSFLEGEAILNHS